MNNAVKFTSNSDKEGKQETINSTDIVESTSPGLVLTVKHLLMVNLQIHKNKVIPVVEKQIQNNQITKKKNLTRGRKHEILII